MRRLVVGIVVSAAFGLTLNPASAASLTRDRAWFSSGDPALRLLRKSVLRVAHRGGERVFVSARPPLTVGIAF